MAVEEQVHMRGRVVVVRGNVHEMDAKVIPCEVEGQGPVGGVAIASHHLDRAGAGEAQLVENPIAADVAQMPDFVGGGDALDEGVGEFVVRIGDDRYASRLG